MSRLSFERNLASVIVPTFNRSGTLGRSIESVLTQSYPLLELVIVDDGSTDATAEVVQKYQAYCRFLRYVKLRSKLGAQGARIEGIKRAQGEYLVFLDSDDELVPRSIELRISTLQESQFEAALVYGDVLCQVGENYERVEFKQLRGYSYKYLTRELSLCPYSAMLISKSCFETVPFPSSKFPAWQDDDMVLTLGKSFPMLHCEQIVAVMYGSGSSISRDLSRAATGCRMIVGKYWWDILTYHGPIRLALWGLRIARAYSLAWARKERAPSLTGRSIRRLSYFMFNTLDWLLRPFYYKMMA
jgi:glycosyltransferase involved in cell wall biosynthesis